MPTSENILKQYKATSETAKPHQLDIIVGKTAKPSTKNFSEVLREKTKT